MSDSDYGRVMDAFSGVNEDNHDEIRRRLVDLGLTAPNLGPSAAPTVP